MVTYGTALKPFLVTACFKKLMVEEREKYPQATTALFNKDFCTDEVLSGCDDVTEPLMHQADLNALLTSARFPLRKWCSNHPRNLKAVPTAAKGNCSTEAVEW
jgi:hypothetical protein